MAKDDTNQSPLDQMVAEKVAAGLSFDTATEVAKRQLEWDAQQAEAAKGSGKKNAEAPSA
jgi:hypothetical protein